jgi:hypothetical protein
MNELSRRFLLTVSLGAMGAAALAQPGPGGPGPGRPGPGGPGMMMRHGPMGPNFTDQATYLASLKSEIGITEAQEAAWKTYTDVVTGTAAQMQALHQSMWEAMGTATWEERRDMMNRAFEARQQAFQTVHDAALALLPALSERQKGKAEVILPGLARRRTGGPGMMPR